MIEEIIICVDEGLAQKTEEMWHREVGDTFQGSFPVSVAIREGFIPVFLSLDQENYLKECGITLKGTATNYRIYIGKQVRQIIEHSAGVELPDLVLEERDTFYREVVQRARMAADSHLKED